MKITSPQPLIDLIDKKRWDQIKGRGSLKVFNGSEPSYVEPPRYDVEGQDLDGPVAATTTTETLRNGLRVEEANIALASEGNISGKVQRLGDFIDTDAVSQPSR